MHAVNCSANQQLVPKPACLVLVHWLNHVALLKGCKLIHVLWVLPVGFFTGRKKESMFAVPEGGKVGVIGSGKGLTEYTKQTRHEFHVEQ